jgi:hypothetical protein
MKKAGARKLSKVELPQPVFCFYQPGKMHIAHTCCKELERTNDVLYFAKLRNRCTLPSETEVMWNTFYGVLLLCCKPQLITTPGTAGSTFFKCPCLFMIAGVMCLLEL